MKEQLVGSTVFFRCCLFGALSLVLFIMGRFRVFSSLFASEGLCFGKLANDLFGMYLAIETLCMKTDERYRDRDRER